MEPNSVWNSSFSRLMYWEQLYLLSFWRKNGLSCPKEGKRKVTQFFVARVLRFSLSAIGENCTDRRSRKKWGSRFRSELGNETRYQCEFLICHS